MFQRVMSQITAVKKDMVILEKSEFSALLAENEVGAFFSGLFSCSFMSSKVLNWFICRQKLKIQILKLKVQLAVRVYSGI